MPRADLDAEVIAEEDGGHPEESPSALPQRYEGPSAPAMREVRSAAIAAAGGALAGAATVAAVRAVSGSRKRTPKRLVRRPDRGQQVVASRSFLIDVHLLGK